jgi:2-beta-glucuronyltransferase
MSAAGAKLAVLVTYHYWGSTRRAGFHGLATGFRDRGWRVVMLTVGLSPLSAVRGNFRLAAVPVAERNRLVWTEPHLGSFAWYTPFHPASLGSLWLELLSTPLFALFPALPLHGAEAVLAAADLVVFESSCGVMLFDRIKRLNATARLVYRVSDDMRWLRLHRLCQRAEQRAAPRFDLISAPSPAIRDKFAPLPQAQFHAHGIDKQLFAAATSSPYEDGIVNAVFIGAGHLDVETLALAASLFPEWRFHVIGPLASLPALDNVVAYGEMAYERTIPYLKFADIGLNFLTYRPFIEGTTENFKTIQYSWCRLPVVTPDFIANPRRRHFLSYRPGDPESLRAALLAARSFDRAGIDTAEIASWADLAGLLAGEESEANSDHTLYDPLKI